MSRRIYSQSIVVFLSLCMVSCSDVATPPQKPVATTQNRNTQSGVEALIKVSRSKPSHTAPLADQSFDEDFKTFRSTQIALLKSTFILNSAVANEEVSGLKSVIEHHSNEVDWLKRNLEVVPLEDSEILRVTLIGIDDPQEAVTILDAVIKSYMDDAVYRVKMLNTSIQEKLHLEHKKLLKELENKYAQLRLLTEKLGTEASKSPRLELFEDEIKNLKEIASEVEVKLRLQSLGIEFESSRIEVLQQATPL